MLASTSTTTMTELETSPPTAVDKPSELRLKFGDAGTAISTATQPIAPPRTKARTAKPTVAHRLITFINSALPCSGAPGCTHLRIGERVGKAGPEGPWRAHGPNEAPFTPAMRPNRGTHQTTCEGSSGHLPAASKVLKGRLGLFIPWPFTS